MSQPHKCPVCLGSKLVPGGFYLVPYGQIQCWTSASASETCQQCSGTGIVWEKENE